MFIIWGGMEILDIAFVNILIFMESYALLMSCDSIQHGLLNSRESSRMLFMIWMGSLVLPPGNPAQLNGESIERFVSVLARRLLSIFVKTFFPVSMSVMGLVMLMSCSQSFCLGMGYIKPMLHCFGISPVARILLKMLVRISSAVFPKCLKRSYLIPDLPGADSFFIFRRVFWISVVVIGCKQLWY